MLILHSQDGATVRLGKGAQEDLTKRSSPGLSLDSWIRWQEFWELMPCYAVCVCDVYKWSGQVIACKYSIYSVRIQHEANVRILLHWIFFGGKRRQNSCSWILIDCTWLVQLEGRVGNHDNYGGLKRMGFGSAMFTCLHHLGEKFQFVGPG